jgi:hypothetical protein
MLCRSKAAFSVVHVTGDETSIHYVTLKNIYNQGHASFPAQNTITISTINKQDHGRYLSTSSRCVPVDLLDWSD